MAARARARNLAKRSRLTLCKYGSGETAKPEPNEIMNRVGWSRRTGEGGLSLRFQSPRISVKRISFNQHSSRFILIWHNVGLGTQNMSSFRRKNSDHRLAS